MTEYVLGTNDLELERLGLQADFWRLPALNLWARAGFRRGHTLLDLGCGPGFATADLVRQVGPGGKVLAVDASERFVAHLKSQLPSVEAWVGDVQQLDLPEGSLDGAWERWCLCFVPRPEQAVRAVARALKPGGAFALHDYVFYESMRLAPRSAAFERVAAAAAQSFRDTGGDPELGNRLPRILHEAGLVVEHLAPIVRVARPQDELWLWPETFFLYYARVLEERGYLTRAQVEEFERDWRARSADPHAAFYTPMVQEVIARKP